VREYLRIGNLGQAVIRQATVVSKGTGSLFKRDGEVQKINPWGQGNMAKELGISISDGKKLF